MMTVLSPFLSIIAIGIDTQGDHGSSTVKMLDSLSLWISERLYIIVMDWIVAFSHQKKKLSFEGLTFSVTLFGCRAFKEVIKVKWSLMVGL